MKLSNNAVDKNKTVWITGDGDGSGVDFEIG